MALFSKSSEITTNTHLEKLNNLFMKEMMLHDPRPA